MEAKKFDKAEKKILKSLKKDSLNPGAKYYLSVLLVHEGYPDYDIDSSWYWIKKAVIDLSKANKDIQKDLRKVELAEEDFILQKSRVASLAFDHASSEMSIPAFEKYLREYKDTDHSQKATSIRDSLAFDIALHQDSWQAYEQYFRSYPNSLFVSEARKRYQALIFKDYTKDDKLESYVIFLEEHPDTPFRRLAEKIIFTRSIVDHQWGSYLNFLNDYPATHLRKKIGDILYYKSKSEDSNNLEVVLNLHSNPDSLRTIHELEKRVLYPVFEGGVFGFMSLANEMILDPKYQHIDEHHLCGNITSEWLYVEEKIINRKNEVILEEIDGFEDLGKGIALVKKQNGRLYHKSGFRISDLPVNNAKVLADGLIAYQAEYDWGVMTIPGHQIIPPQYQSIDLHGQFVILEEEDSFRVAGLNQLKSIQGNVLVTLAFDDYEVIGDTLFQGFQGDRECLLDKDMNFLIPLDTHSIYVTQNNWYVKDASGYQLYDKKDTELMNQKFAYLDANEGWITLKRDSGWLLISKMPGPMLVMKELDSVQLISANSAFIKKGDSLEVLFQTGKRELLQKGESVQLLSNQNVHYLLFASGNRQRILDASGNLLFTSRNDGISLLGDSTFRNKKHNKVGVLDKHGNVLVSASYDLADENDGLIFLLKDDGIGSYDISKNLLIPTVYETRIFSFGPGHYMVRKGGKVGLIDGDNNLTVPAEYDQLISWNDSTLWARKADEWKLVTFDNAVLLEGIRSVNFWFENENESYATILVESGIGVVSNVNGEILPALYNDILNVGSETTPIFFAEQHLKAASFYVVTYFDRQGNNVRSQAFRPEEYEKIYCDL